MIKTHVANKPVDPRSPWTSGLIATTVLLRPYNHRFNSFKIFDTVLHRRFLYKHVKLIPYDTLHFYIFVRDTIDRLTIVPDSTYNSK